MTDNPESVFRPAQREKPAPCQASCPNCGDIRGWIGVIAQRSKTGRTDVDISALGLDSLSQTGCRQRTPADIASTKNQNFLKHC